jgi:quinol monooxygenase YgiN
LKSKAQISDVPGNWKSQEAIDEHMRTPHFKSLVVQAEPLAEPLSITLLRALSE